MHPHLVSHVLRLLVVCGWHLANLSSTWANLSRFLLTHTYFVVTLERHVLVRMAKQVCREIDTASPLVGFKRQENW